MSHRWCIHRVSKDSISLQICNLLLCLWCVISRLLVEFIESHRRWCPWSLVITDVVVNKRVNDDELYISKPLEMMLLMLEWLVWCSWCWSHWADGFSYNSHWNLCWSWFYWVLYIWNFLMFIMFIMFIWWSYGLSTCLCARVWILICKSLWYTHSLRDSPPLQFGGTVEPLLIVVIMHSTLLRLVTAGFVLAVSGPLRVPSVCFVSFLGVDIITLTQH